MATQKDRRVMSDLRADFFKKSFNLKIFFAEIRNGRVKTSPAVPYERLESEGVWALRNF